MRFQRCRTNSGAFSFISFIHISILINRTVVLVLCNMRHDKEKVFELRRSGKSYRELEVLTGVSRSTLCEWFRNEDWSSHIKQSNTATHKKISTEHLIKLNQGRQATLDGQYAKVEKEAREEFETHKENSLFMAGLMLYAGEGDKVTRGIIRLANIDFGLHKIFINFITTFLRVEIKDLRCSILLYPDLDIEKCKIKWSEELGIPLTQFHKPQVIQGRHKTKRLHFGVGSTIFSSSFLKRKLLLWIELAKKSLPTQGKNMRP